MEDPRGREVMLFLRRVGRALAIEDMEPLKKPVGSEGLARGGRGRARQGVRRLSIQVCGSKKSTGYSSPVSLSKKQRPLRGRRAKEVRIVKFTCAVSTRLLRRTSSPLRRGPRMLTQVRGHCGLKLAQLLLMVRLQGFHLL